MARLVTNVSCIVRCNWSGDNIKWTIFKERNEEKKDRYY